MRTRLLIDSELLLLALAAPARLPRDVRVLLDAAEVYVSAASILEIGCKSTPGTCAAEVLDALEPSGFRTLAVTAEHAALAGELPAGWRDAFDRLLVAQASAEQMTFVTTDAALAGAAGAAPPAKRRGRRGTQASRPRRPEPAVPRCRVLLAAVRPPGRRARA